MNNTFAINLSQDWTNSTVTTTTIERPPGAVAFNAQTLWWYERNGTIYCFGGENSGYHLSMTTPQESIWGLSIDGRGGGNWSEFLGPTSQKPFPQDILRPSGPGFYGDDGENGYYFGGHVDRSSSPSITLPWGQTIFTPGLLTFNFDSLTLTNNTNVANAVTSSATPSSGRMLHAPSFGPAGILVALGGGLGQLEAGGPFNNISIFDLGNKKWYYQEATGAIPYPRSGFCAVGAQGKDNSTFEMSAFLLVTTSKTNVNISSLALFMAAVSTVTVQLPTLQYPRVSWLTSTSCPCHPSDGSRPTILRVAQG